MSSELPSPANDYQAPTAPERLVFDKQVYNHVMGSIGSRLRGLEDQRVTLVDLINDLRLFGLERLDAAIVPIIESAEARLAQLAADIAATEAANAAILDDFQEVTAVNLEALGQQIEAAQANLVDIEEEFATIIAGGLPAAQIQESLTRIFFTPEERAELEAIRDALTTAQNALVELTAQKIVKATFLQRATANQLAEGRMYFITDTDEFAIARSASTYHFYENRGDGANKVISLSAYSLAFGG